MVTITLHWWYLPLILGLVSAVILWWPNKETGMFAGMGKFLAGLVGLLFTAGILLGHFI